MRTAKKQLSRSECSVIFSAISGKLKPYILWYLHSTPNGVCRYGELKRLVPYDISHKIFTQQLQELESYNVIKRTEYDEKPKRVEYSLTECGKSVVPILQSICHWAGAFYKEETPGQPMIQCRKCDYRFASTAINGKSAGHRIFSAACFSSAAKGDIMGTGKAFFAKWMDVLCRWKKQRSIWKAKAAWTM